MDVAGGPAGFAQNGCGLGRAQIVVSDAASGTVVLTQEVPEGQSYTIVLPAGAYHLSAGFDGGPTYCPGDPSTFTVEADKRTEDSAVCDLT